MMHATPPTIRSVPVSPAKKWQVALPAAAPDPV